MTISSSSAFTIQGGAVNGGGAVTNAFGLYVNAPTGATNNYAAVFNGGNVGIGTTSPQHLLDLGSSYGTNPGDAAAKKLAVYQNAAGTAFYGLGLSSATLEFHADSTSTEVSGMVLKDTGNVGIGTTSPTQKLSIGSVASGGNVKIANGWLCVDNNDTCTGATTAGTVYAVGAYTTGADVAENYPTLDTFLEAGDVVMADGGLPVHVVRATSPNAILGIISTKPGILLNGYKSQDFGNASSVPVALAGRVPVKVTNENGQIKIGDYLTASMQFYGYAMKATHSTKIIGQALEDFTSATTGDSGKILVFIQIGWQNVNNTFVLGEEDGQLAGATSTLGVVASPLASFLINQKGSGNILQLQSSGQDRFLVATTGSVSILAVATSTQNILSVYNGTTTMFTINSVGDVQTTGHIIVGKDTAGTVTIKAGDDQVDVSFDRAYISTPKVIISAQGLPDFFYGVATKTPIGFKIQASKALTTDMSFDWVAFQQPIDTVGISSQSLSVVSAPSGSATISPISPIESGSVAGTSTPLQSEPVTGQAPAASSSAPVDATTPPTTPETEPVIAPVTDSAPSPADAPVTP